MKKISKRLLAVLFSLIIAITMTIPAFAGGSVSGNTGYISSGTTTVTSSDIPANIWNRLNVTVIYVPDTVTTISAGAFSGLDNLETVYIDNTAGNVTVAAGALPSGAAVVYTGVEEPTVTEAPATTRRTYRTTRRTTARTTEATTEETTKEEETTPSETETTTILYTNAVDVETDDTGVNGGSKTGRTVAVALVAAVAVSAVALIVLKLKK